LEEEVRGSNASLYQADPLAELELRRLREEVDILRGELQRAEGELEDRLCWTPPPDLQHWLQLTYELEQRVYNKKRLQAEKQLEQAKDAVILIFTSHFFLYFYFVLIRLVFFFSFSVRN
jgi:stromal interaction molecule 1